MWAQQHVRSSFEDLAQRPSLLAHIFCQILQQQFKVLLETNISLLCREISFYYATENFLELSIFSERGQRIRGSGSKIIHWNRLVNLFNHFIRPINQTLTVQFLIRVEKYLNRIMIVKLFFEKKIKEFPKII